MSSAAAGRPYGEDPELQGIVKDVLPNGMFRVELEGGHQVRVHVAGTGRTHLGRVLIGDRVTVALSSNDPGRGRIIEKRDER